MYIRKSVLNGLIILTGLCILIAMAFIFCFTRDTDTACSILRGLDYLSAVRIFFSG